jgi:hypothetical protein
MHSVRERTVNCYWEGGESSTGGKGDSDAVRLGGIRHKTDYNSPQLKANYCNYQFSLSTWATDPLFLVGCKVNACMRVLASLND